jgi:cell volume regulation protein A
MIRWAPFPDRTLYPVAVILMVGVVYGAATVAHGSGFLAVFVAGILVGDLRFEARRAVRAFNAALGELGELATFVALGLTVDLAFIGDEGLWWRGIVFVVVLFSVVVQGSLVPTVARRLGVPLEESPPPTAAPGAQ